MKKKQVEVFFDYICPFCYRGLNDLMSIQDDYPDLDFIYRPSKVHFENSETPVQDSSMDRVLKVFLNEADLEYNKPFNPISDTNLAFKAMNYLQEHHGKVDLYNYNIYKAHFVDQKNIADINIILDCASSCGIEVEKLKEFLTNEDYSRRHQEDLEYAYLEKKIEFVPTLIMEDKRLNAIEAQGFTKEQLIKYLDSI